MDNSEYQINHITCRTRFKEMLSKMGDGTFEKDYCKNDILDYWDKKEWWDYSTTANVLIKVSQRGAGKVVAGCAYKTINDVLHIKRVFTSTNWRKQGHAHDLLKIAWRTEFTCARFLRMYCDRDAIPFYEKLGFTMLHTNPAGYGYVYQPMLFRDMDFTLKHCENYDAECLLDQQDKVFISYDFK